MLSRRTFLAALAGAGVVGTGLTARGYRRAMAAARARIAGPSTVIDTRHGALEYAEAGSGPPVLFLHGTGGGFDQGLDMAAPLVALGYRVIAPSRFGYLGSALPADPGRQAQAEALVDLLDHLRLERVPVAGGSAGAIPAISFAILHPERCAALIAIVPAVYAHDRAPVEPWGPVQRRLAEAALNSDLVFWAAISVAPETMVRTLLATDPALLRTAGAGEQARARRVLRNILPISARKGGLMNDAYWTGRPIAFDYAAVRAPTLVISLEDDRFETAESARHIAARTEGARLVIYPDGGHIWIGREAELFGEIDAFLKQNAVG